jgi:putative ABC transport system ATP-binding protein
VKPQYIHLEGIGKLFAGSSSPNVALHDINLVIERGEYVVLTGPSGSGKSTLLSLLGLLEDATSGSYVLGGRDVSSMSFSEKAKTRNTEIGFVFQNFNLIGELSVGDNVAVPLTFRSGMSAKERAKRVATALEQVGLAQLARGKPSELSGGEQQRVAVARALAGTPSILLADEPTGNLDTENGQSIMSLLSELHADGSTVCLITHEPRWIESGRKVISLPNGKVTSYSQY